MTPFDATTAAGHIEIVEQCRDYLAHEVMDNGDPSGKLTDFTEALSGVVSQLEAAGEYDDMNERIDRIIKHRLSKIRALAEGEGE